MIQLSAPVYSLKEKTVRTGLKSALQTYSHVELTTRAPRVPAVHFCVVKVSNV